MLILQVHKLRCTDAVRFERPPDRSRCFPDPHPFSAYESPKEPPEQPGSHLRREVISSLLKQNRKADEVPAGLVKLWYSET